MHPGGPLSRGEALLREPSRPARGHLGRAAQSSLVGLAVHSLAKFLQSRVELSALQQLSLPGCVILLVVIIPEDFGSAMRRNVVA